MPTKNNNHSPRSCSFCGRDETQVEFLIPSPTGLFICDNCVDACRSLIDEHLRHQDCDESFTRESLPKPAEIKATLDEYVIGQDDAKRAVAVALRNRYRRAQLPEDIREEVPGIDLDKEFLVKATDLVKKNLSTEFNVDTLCAKLHMSRSSLYNKIKALTGHSPSDFVRQIRMDEAATLLKSNQYSIAEISDKLGFGDPKYFTDIFKKHYGVTPSAYMKKEKK